MDFSIFKTTPGAKRFATSSPYTLGTRFTVWGTGPVYVKRLRFYRQSTGIFGRIRGRIYSHNTGLPVPGSDVSITLPQGSGPTGWIELPYQAPLELPVSEWMVAFHFPGGTGNGIPQSQDVPTYNGLETTHDYWRIGPGAYGWKNGPLQLRRSNPQIGSPNNNANSWYAVGPDWKFPVNGSGVDHGLDLVVTDTNPSPPAEAADVSTLWGTTTPASAVTLVPGQSVVGLEFTPVRDVWATTLRAYRLQSTRPRRATPTPVVLPSMTAYESSTAGDGDPGMAITNTREPYGTITGALYTVDSATSGTQVPGAIVNFRNDTLFVPGIGTGIIVDGATGWWEGYLNQPVRLAANQRYRVVVAFKDGRSSTPNFFAGGGPGAQGLSSGALFVHGTSTATGGAASSVITGSSTLAFPTTASSANPHIDVTVTTANPNDPREPEQPLRTFGTLAPREAMSIGIGRRTVGLEFTVTAPATAYGLRYYVYQGIAATSGRLYAVTWDAAANPVAIPTGTVVAGSEVTFPSGPADGWQFTAFRAPLRLAIGQRYRIAITFNNGYIVSRDYFSPGQPGGDGLVMGPITMPPPAGAAAGTQGSYTLEDGGFPTETFNDGNPWVDLTVEEGGSTAAGAAGTAGSPSGAVSLWGADVPAAVVVTNPNTRVVGLEFMVVRAATAHGFRFYRPSVAVTGAVQVRLFAVGGEEIATEVVGGDTTFDLTAGATGWVYAGLRAPIALVAGRRYKMVFFFPSGYPTTPDYFVADRPAAISDIVDPTLGLLRAFSLANATRAAQPTAMVGGTMSDGVVYPTAAATDNPWIDITVTDGVAAGAVTTGEEPVGVGRAWGTTDPAPGDIATAVGPQVAGHEFTLSAASNLYGLRMWRPDLRQQVAVGRVYRADTNTTVTGTTVAFPPSTSRGWVYAPLAAPIALIPGVAYRVVVAHPVLGPSTVNALTAPVSSGVVSTRSAWRIDNPATAAMAYPTTVSTSNYWVDVSVVPGAGVPEETLTLFGATPDAAVQVRTTDTRSVGTTFGGTFGNEPAVGTFWVKALRFWRPNVSVAGIVTGRIYQVTTSGRSVPVPGTDVVINLVGNNATGWISAELPRPVRLTTYPWYRVAMYFPSGYPSTANYFTTGPGGQDRFGPNGIVYTPPTNYAGGDGAQGAYLASASLGYPYRGVTTRNGNATGEEVGTNYWVDVVCTTAAPDITTSPNPRFPLSYSQWGQITSNTEMVGSVIRYAQIANGAIRGAGTVGLEFTVTRPCYLHGFRIPRADPTQQVLAPSARLYMITGPTTGAPVAGTGVDFTLTPNYWQTAYLGAAVRLVPGQRYKAVYFFPDAVPHGRPYSNTTNLVRGPLYVPGNNDAVGGAVVTVAPSYSMTYPSAPAQLTALGTPVVDLYVSERDPNAPDPDVRSVFDRRRPEAITYAPWGQQQNSDGSLGEGWTAGMEFYVTTDTCYLKGFRYWKAPYPVVSQVTAFRVYRVTGATPPGTPDTGYYPPRDIDFDITQGVAVAGTSTTWGLNTTDLNQPEAYSEGWVTIPLSTPVLLTPGTRYRMAAFFPFRQNEASRPMTDFFWQTGPGASGIVDGPLIAPGRNESFNTQQAPYDSRSVLNPEVVGGHGGIWFPGSHTRSNAAHYWIDLEMYDSAPRTVDGGVVTVTIPNAAHDPRITGVDTRGLVAPALGVRATAIAERFSYTDPLAPPLNVIAVGIGGRDIVAVNPDVRPAGFGTKAVEGGVVVADAPVTGRNASRRPKGAGDEVVVTIAPIAVARETIEWRPMPREADVFTPEGGYPSIRFIAQDIMSRRFAHWDLPLNNPTIEWNLSGPFHITGTLNPAYVDLLDMGVDEWATFIHVEIDDRIWGTGIMMPWTARGEQFTIEAYGISSYAQGTPYIDSYTWPGYIPDVMDVVREMWRHIQSFDNGNLGLQLPAGILGLPVFGEPVYDTQTGKFLGWKYTSLSWTDFTDIGAYIDNLAKSQPFDYIEIDQWNSTRTDVLHGIRFAYPRAGEKRHNLRFAEGENVLEVIAISEPSDAYASDIVVKGAGQGPTQIFSWVGDSFWFRLRRVLIITDTQIQSQKSAQGIAIAELIRRLYLRGTESIVIDAWHPHAPFGSYRVGDDILIEGMTPWVGEFMLWHRILGIALQPETGLVTLSLQRSEAFRYGRPDPTAPDDLVVVPR